MRRALVLLSTLLMVVAALVSGGVPATAAIAAADLQIQKSVDSAGPHGPGDTFSYSIMVGCSSTTELGCVDAVLTDVLPEPLVLDPAVQNPVTVSMSPGGTSDVQVQGGDRFTVRPQHALGTGTGLLAGGSMSITVSVMVPTTVSADFDGEELTNVASVVAENADEQTSSADVTLAVTTTLEADVDKTVAPGTVPAVPGKPVTWTITPANASNQTVDTIVVEDVFTGTNRDHLDFVSLDATPAPESTTSTTVEYRVEGAWTTTAPQDPADVEGVRVTYRGSYAPGTSGSLTIATRTNDLVEAIPDRQSLQVQNTAVVTVAKGEDTSDEARASAQVRILKSDPDVTIDKTISDSTLVVGQPVTFGLHAAVGERDVHELVIHEPSDGRPGFTEQGLVFTGFGSDVEWPVGAVEATVSYTYADCAASTASTTTADTIPAPSAGCVVEGFTLTFTAEDGEDGIATSAYADIPIELTALTDIDELVSSTNHVDTQVTTVDGATGTDSDSAAFTVRPLEVFTQVSKTITPDTIYAVPGADATVSLPASVRSDSTAGSDRLVISDPADPSQGSEFFDAFTATEIADTDIPACAQLTVRYWSKAEQAWVVLPGAANVQGPVNSWGIAVPRALRADIGGIQYDFAPVPVNGCAQTLPPGFNVIPSFGVELRAGVANAPAEITNTVRSTVFNAAIDKGDTAQAQDVVELEPLDGDGPDLVDKTWLDDSVPALSGQTRTARIGWSTQGLNYATVVITDPASAAELGPNGPGIASSVYDAFDLAAIAPIRPTTDPLIVNDQVAKVELFRSGAWVDVTTQACSTELACRGTFPGLTLTTAQRADTTGARLTLQEIVAGEGVGSSRDRRPMDLDFRLRDTLRSSGEYVLGTFHPYTYNTGQQGVVDNTVRLQAFGGTSGTHESNDADKITIIDSPVNVELSKVFDQTRLGLPELGSVAGDDYPLITGTLTARNTSAVRISSLEITDPDPDQVAPTAYDTLDLHQIAGLTIPSGLAAVDVSVVLDHDGTSRTYTRAEALALTPADLADVVGVTVRHERAGGAPLIASNATARVELVFQLRAERRSGDGPVEVTGANGSPILNRAHVQADSPGRIACVTPTTPACSIGTDADDAEFTITAADFSLAGAKSVTPENVFEDGAKEYTTTLSGQPLGSARASVLTMTDDAATFWNVMDYTGSQVTLPAPLNGARLDVLTEDGWKDGVWRTASSGSTVTFALPDGVSAADVVGVRYSFRQVVDGRPVQWERPYNPRVSVRLATTRRDTQRSTGEPVSTTRPGVDPNEDESARGVISNDMTVRATGQFGLTQTFEAEETYDDTTVVRHRANAIRVEKSPGNATRPPTFAPSAPIPYVLTITNTGSWAMTGLSVVDQFELVDGASPVTEPAPAQYSFSLARGTGVPVPETLPAFAADYDQASGALTVEMPEDFVFRPGWILTVNAPMLVAPGITADTVIGNSVTATSDRDFETCVSTLDRVNRPVTTNVAACTATTHVQPLASATISMRKGVKGDDAGAPGTSADDLGVVDLLNRDPSECATPAADGFYRGSCIPVTRPGGEATWQLEMTNTGNTNAKVVAVVDTLPAVGDRGVITSSPRGSQFGVTLRQRLDSTVGALQDGNGVLRAYYSSARLSTACNTNAIQVHTNNATPTGSCGFGWTEYTDATPNSALADAQSVKFVIDWSNAVGTGLRPGETVAITFNTRTPAQLPAAVGTGATLPIAYNSFAGTARTVATRTQAERGEIVLEPTRVGIATATGRLTVEKAVEAPEFSVPVDLPGTYAFEVACTVDGRAVTLRDANGEPFGGRVTVAVDADGAGSTVLNAAGQPLSVPLFAECTVVETDVPAGATPVSVPADGTVVADRSLAGVTGIQRPHEGATDGPTVAVTNRFADGGFSIAKTVSNGGAEDQEGEPVVYDREYVFAVECRYLGAEILNESITLRDGESESFSELPTGARCSVEETDDAGAASVDVTIDGDEAANPASFTIGDGTDVAVEVTNTFEVGSVRIEKSFTGPGAADWGLEPVRLRLVCELGGVVTETVYDDVRTLQAPDDLVWSVTDLPIGASCTVTEPLTGGANDVQIEDEQFEVVSAGQVVRVGVENFFDEGAVTATKTLSGEGAAFDVVRDGTYTMELQCTREIDGDVREVVVPGGAERRITGAGTATWDGLPTGAACAVTETSSSPASQAVTMTPQDGAIVVPAAGASAQVTVDNRFDAGFLRINKLVDGPGEGLHDGASFEFDVDCTLAEQVLLDESVTIERDGGATSLWSDPIGPLPTGTSCHVVETAVGGADRTTREATVVIGAGTDAEAVVATITNTYGAGELVVSKETEGRYAEHEEVARMRFAMTVTCQLETVDATGASVLGTVFESDFTLRAGRTKSFTAADGSPLLLPTGTRCFADETDDGGATDVRISHDSYENGAEVASVDTTAQLAIVVTNVFASDVWSQTDERSDDGADDDGGTLADSGSGLSVGWGVLGALSLLAGAMALATRRRMRIRG